MQQTFHCHPRRPGLTGAARDLAALTFTAFEALAERRYAAPWAAPSRRSDHTC